MPVAYNAKTDVSAVSTSMPYGARAKGQGRGMRRMRCEPLRGQNLPSTY